MNALVLERSPPRSLKGPDATGRGVSGDYGEDRSEVQQGTRRGAEWSRDTRGAEWSRDARGAEASWDLRGRRILGDCETGWWTDSGADGDPAKKDSQAQAKDPDGRVSSVPPSEAPPSTWEEGWEDGGPRPRRVVAQASD